MKKMNLVISTMMIAAFLCSHAYGADERADIEKVIKASYFNGAFNDLDTDSMRKGFHPDFAIFSATGNELSRYPIDVWIKGIEKGKERPDFDKAQAKMDCKMISLDITGTCAAAKIEISQNGTMVYTDYLSLLKFDDGWKIAAKVYYAHPNREH